MAGLQNNSTKQSNQNNGKGKSGSGKKWYRPKGQSNSSKGKNNNNQPKGRELKFHLHGADNSKKAETFERIKE